MPATDLECQAAADFLAGDYVRLGELASLVINEHSNDSGLCAVCGTAFPCERARFAENNLTLLS